jgi:glycosyltransferase involved in cell wall biosynthesis
MRVLFFNEGNLGTFIMGQAQLEASLRAHSAAADGLEARFAGLTPQGRLAQAAIERTPGFLVRRDLHLPTVRWHAVQSTRARRTLRRELAQWRPDVLHVHSHSIALRLGRTLRAIPTALSVDTTITDWSTMPAWRPSGRVRHGELRAIAGVERRRLTEAAVVLAWTDWARRRVLALAPHANVVEHHPGLDLTTLTPARREPRERPRVLFVGGRFAEKGGEDLLAALGDGLGTTVDLDLVTPAEVAPRPGLRVHRLGPSDPELLRLRQQADVFCLPSLGDAAPWAVLEAMACGVPTVGADVGGIPDLLGGDEAGIVVAPGDRAALGAALKALLDDPARRAALGAAARARTEARYDATRQAPLLLDHLRAIAAR